MTSAGPGPPGARTSVTTSAATGIPGTSATTGVTTGTPGTSATTTGAGGMTGAGRAPRATATTPEGPPPATAPLPGTTEGRGADGTGAPVHTNKGSDAYESRIE